MEKCEERVEVKGLRFTATAPCKNKAKYKIKYNTSSNPFLNLKVCGVHLNCLKKHLKKGQCTITKI